MSALTIGSLFSGIGGLELGLEWAGLGPTRWQVEQNPWCRDRLAEWWPDARRYDDVCTAGAHNLAPVDVICGGFPCQDISYAGYGAGLAGARSGLWYEFARIVRELGPRYVVVENVAALLDRGMGDVLGTLADLGYDAEWSCISACAVGASHALDRVFVMAYPRDDGLQGRTQAGDAGRRRAVAPQLPSRPLPSPVWLDRAASNLGGSTHGIPDRAHRIKALGNAVVPQVAEVVGRLIAEREAALSQEAA